MTNMLEPPRRYTLIGNKGATIYPRDIFISHASEDKSQLARPLDRALNSLGVSTWYDEATIEENNSYEQAINRGLDLARLVVVLVTPAFLKKKWPARELADSLAAQSTDEPKRLRIRLQNVTREELQAAMENLGRNNNIEDLHLLEWDSDTAREAVRLRADVERAAQRTTAEWHYGEHRKEYIGDIWTRITADPEQQDKEHLVTFVWGAYVVSRRVFVGREPLSLLHHKSKPDQVGFQVHIVPAARVTYGEGRLPDAAFQRFDAGWDRMSGFPV